MVSADYARAKVKRPTPMTRAHAALPPDSRGGHIATLDDMNTLDPNRPCGCNPAPKPCCEGGDDEED